VRRRTFIAGLGIAAAWPVVARAQQPTQRRVGYVGGHIKDAYGDALFAAFRQGLAARGWIDGRNVEIIDRYGAADPVRSEAYTEEMLKLAPDVIVSAHIGTTSALLKNTSAIPIVAPQMGDPVALGLVESIAHPGRNLTGFANDEPTWVTKRFELLKEAVPQVSHILILAHPGFSRATSDARRIEVAATSMGVTSTTRFVRNPEEIQEAIAGISRHPDSGIVVMGGPELSNQTSIIVESAIRYRVAAIYPTRDYVMNGGLMSYAHDILDQYRRTGAYVDRILKGAKVSELPIQFPTRFELLVNLKTAKGIGLTLSDAFLLRADELIE
jgi:putative ABC transport system substrate-binding protein